MVINRKYSFSQKSPIFPLTVYKALVFCVFAGFLGSALSVPFLYETETLWYKTGIGKLMLIAGQSAGLFTLVLLILQIFLSLRGRFFENLFGVSTLLRWHRRNGVIIAYMAICHVVLILAPDGILNLPFGKKYWPEMFGEGLFLLLLLTVISSYFRSVLRFDYKIWRAIHRPVGYLALALVLIHVLLVSDSFKRGIPRIVLLTVFTGLALLVTSVKISRWTIKS